ncbi:MAG TPA: SAM-dependent methyltransferase [Phycisphaerae bacterium]|nr:TlyA family rRNA (cytidine-2'-O)-methyltransferase [Phycisphaerae bacterium]HOI55059.1 SAM-dependent methyltransferase [Phycisphaerae bacterium]
MDRQTPDNAYVTRAGVKLEHALRQFAVSPAGLVCADLGSHEGGFVDCLLQHAAAKVYSVDTSYGILAWKLRRDPRVVVMERTNAMHVELPERVDLVTIDVGWTPQRRILPRALSLIKDGGRLVVLVKPQYESLDAERDGGVVLAQCMPRVLDRVRATVADCGARVLGETVSPIRGSGGNEEWLFLLSRQ